MRNRYLSAAALLLAWAGVANATITMGVTTSRTSCKAPCAVEIDGATATGLSTFDGTTNDYVGTSWTWDWDSTVVNTGGEPHRFTTGFLGAHVYDSPGTYVVAIFVKDMSGATASTTVTITVSAMTGTTYYVASAGSGTTCSVGSPCSLTTGLTHVAQNNSVLLRNSDTFTTTSTLSFGLTGPFVFGSYSDPGSPSSTAPVINANVGGSAYIGDVNSSTDVRIVGLHFVAGTGVVQGWNVTGSTNALFERVEQEQVGMPSAGGINFLVEDISDYTFFVDSHFHDFKDLGIYGDRSKHVSILGTTIDRYIGADHGTRIQGGNPTDGVGFALHTFIGYSTYIPLLAGGAFDCFAIRGDNTDSVAVGNYCTSTSSWTPQNDMRLEHVSNFVVENNICDVKEAPATSTCYSIEAQHGFIRNNVMLNTDNGIKVQGQSQVPTGYVDKIYIYNNTMYSAGLYPGGGGAGTNQVRFLVHGEGGVTMTGNVTATGNIFDCLSTSGSSVFFEEDGGGTSTLSYQDWWAPNASITVNTGNMGTNAVHGNPSFVSTTVGNANFMRLGSGSAARDASVSTATWFDAAGTSRPQNSTWDMGAYEYVSAGAVTTTVAPALRFRGSF